MHIASFPGPAQLSVICITEKRGEPGIFSHLSITYGKWWKFAELTGCNSRIYIHAQRLVCPTVGPRLVHPRTIKPFLPSFLSWWHSREKRYQALSRFSILQATESWVGPRNEATCTHTHTHKCFQMFSWSGNDQEGNTSEDQCSRAYPLKIELTHFAITVLPI